MPMKKPMRRRRARKGRKMALKRAITNKNQNTFSTACRWNASIQVTPGPGGSGPQTFLYFTTSALDGVAQLAYTREHVVYSKLFDQYRITGVTMRFIPQFTQTMLVDQASVPTGLIGNFIYSSWDQDNAIPSSLQPIQTLRSTRKHDFRRKIARSFRYTYKDNSWLDTDTDYNSTRLSNWISKGLYGNFGVYAENLPYDPADPTNGVAGSIEVVYHVVYRGQRIVNVSQTEGGLVTLGNPEADVKPVSTLIVHSGLKDPADDNELDDVVPAPPST